MQGLLSVEREVIWPNIIFPKVDAKNLLLSTMAE